MSGPGTVPSWGVCGRVGVLCLNSWAGRVEAPVEVVGETPKRYRVRYLRDGYGTGGRWFVAGTVGLVPKYAVRIEPAQPATSPECAVPNEAEVPSPQPPEERHE